MSSKILAVVLFAVGCLTAAAGGAYFAVRHNAAPEPAGAAVPAAAASTSPGSPVAESEAVVSPAATVTSAPATVVTTPLPPEPVERRVAPRRQAPPRQEARRTVSAGTRSNGPAGPAAETPGAAAVERPLPAVAPAPVEIPAPEPPPLPPLVLFEDVVVPASSVIGLQVETPLSSERAQVEDRVDARVTRDVSAEGRVAIPAGARAIGAVTLVERGGKVKERARLGVRFHTLVLADGSTVPIDTEAVFREGEPPSGESARKIGGAAVGGAILGALMGGKKGAAIGGAAGAGAGTAAVMAGGRNAATIPAGTVLTVRLSAPVAIEVEKR
jgi:hypothetical protein